MFLYCKSLTRLYSTSVAAFKDLQSDKHDINNIPDVSSSESDDDEATVITAESENNKDAPLIKAYYDVDNIVWKNVRDINGVRKRMKAVECNEDLETGCEFAITAIREEAKEFESDVHDTAARFRKALECASDAFRQV